jgi:hypothetical protein
VARNRVENQRNSGCRKYVIKLVYDAGHMPLCFLIPNIVIKALFTNGVVLTRKNKSYIICMTPMALCCELLSGGIDFVHSHKEN